MVWWAGGSDGIRQAPGFEAETPEAAQSVRKEQTVVERGDCDPAGDSAGSLEEVWA